MQLQFELGESSRPRGHALVYFRDIANADLVGATYIIVLPINVDIAKYVPPFLAGQIESIGTTDMSAFTFPPAPEPAESEAAVRSLAELRGDDLLFGGAQRLDDPANLMGLVGSITSEYKRLYDDFVGRDSILKEAGPGLADSDEEGVHDLVYGLMSEADLLGELTKLMGQLRYAIEGGDKATAAEAESKLRAVGRHVPANRRIDLLVGAATGSDAESPELTGLFLERAYGLFREDYRAVKSVEDQIRALAGEVLRGNPGTGGQSGEVT